MIQAIFIACSQRGRQGPATENEKALLKDFLAELLHRVLTAGSQANDRKSTGKDEPVADQVASASPYLALQIPSFC